jgi:hypothetical protein
MDSSLLNDVIQIIASRPESIPALVSVLLGGLAQFLNFVIRPSEVLGRVKGHSEQLNEKAADTLRAAIEFGTRALLEEPQSAINPYEKHVKEFERVLGVKKDLDRIYRRARSMYVAFFASVIAGVALFVTAILWPNAGPTVAIIGAVMLIAQTAGVVYLFILANALERTERQT